MAATYRALKRKAEREHAVKSARGEKWRNRLTGALVIGALIAAAVYAGGGSGLGRLPAAGRLRKVGTTPDGRPVYAS
jgi:hypothetical protein